MFTHSYVITSDALSNDIEYRNKHLYLSGMFYNRYRYDGFLYVLVPHKNNIYLVANSKLLFQCHHFCLAIVNNTICLLAAYKNTISIIDITTYRLIKTLKFDSVITFTYNNYLVVQHKEYVASYILDIALNCKLLYKLNKVARPLYADDDVIVLSVWPKQQVQLYTYKFKHFYSSNIYDAGACKKRTESSVTIFTNRTVYELDIKYSFWHRLFCCLY
jgi:hypothetical protein